MQHTYAFSFFLIASYKPAAFRSTKFYRYVINCDKQGTVDNNGDDGNDDENDDTNDGNGDGHNDDIKAPR